MKKLLIVLFVMACGDNELVIEPECANTTEYLGPEITCHDGEGVCVRTATGLGFCAKHCAVGSPICDTGEWWYTLTLEDGAHSCYCLDPRYNQLEQPVCLGG